MSGLVTQPFKRNVLILSQLPLMGVSNNVVSWEKQDAEEYVEYESILE